MASFAADAADASATTAAVEESQNVTHTLKARLSTSDDGNTVMVNEYTIEKLLGRGAFASVHLCRRKTKKGDRQSTANTELADAKMSDASASASTVEDGIENGNTTNRTSTSTSSASSVGDVVDSVLYPDVFAMKIINKSMLKKKKEIKVVDGKRVWHTPLLDKVHKEIAIMKLIKHRNLVKLFEVIDDPDTQKLYLVLEFMSGGQIMEWNGAAMQYECTESKKPLSEEMARYYMHDVVVGLDYLHSNFIAHRDLKPENILKHADGHAVIADFGVAHFFDEENDDSSEAGGKIKDRRADNIAKQVAEREKRVRSKSQCSFKDTDGTYQFMAPEMCDGSAYNGFIADVWALGVTLYTMVLGELPFWHHDFTRLFDQIKHNAHTFPSDIELSASLKDLLNKMLEKDPNKRITLQAMKSHAWFAERSAQGGHIRHMRQLSDVTPEILRQPSAKEVAHALTPFHKVIIIHKIQRKIRHLKERAAARVALLHEMHDACEEGDAEKLERVLEDQSTHWAVDVYRPGDKPAGSAALVTISDEAYAGDRASTSSRTSLDSSKDSGEQPQIFQALGGSDRSDKDASEKARVSSLGSMGITMLHRVSTLGLADMVHLLLEAGANPNVATVTGDTPLHYAAKLGRDAKDCVQLLLEAGAKAYPTNDEGYTAYAEEICSDASVRQILSRHAQEQLHRLSLMYEDVPPPPQSVSFFSFRSFSNLLRSRKSSSAKKQRTTSMRRSSTGSNGSVDVNMAANQEQKKKFLRVGYLQKQGYIFRTWNRRYFVLTRKGLLYFKTRAQYELGQSATGHIPVEHMIRPEARDENGESGFKLITMHRTFLFFAETDADAKGWMAQINKTIDGEGRRNVRKSRLKRNQTAQ